MAKDTDAAIEDADAASMENADTAAIEDADAATGVAESGESPSEARVRTRVMVDPRGQRFSAALSVLVMAIALLVGLESDLGVVLLTVQGVAFGLGAMFGLRFQPYGWLYRATVRPRLGPPAHFEDEPPPRFAQFVGFVFITIALAGVAFGVPTVSLVAVGFALAAGFLNAAFGFCLGCHMYLSFKRLTSR